MDEELLEREGLRELNDFIRDILKGWPLITQNYDPTKETLDEKLIRLRMLDVQPLFLFYLEANPKKPDQAIMRVHMEI